MVLSTTAVLQKIRLFFLLFWQCNRKSIEIKTKLNTWMRTDPVYGSYCSMSCSPYSPHCQKSSTVMELIANQYSYYLKHTTRFINILFTDSAWLPLCLSQQTQSVCVCVVERLQYMSHNSNLAFQKVKPHPLFKFANLFTSHKINWHIIIRLVKWMSFSSN